MAAIKRGSVKGQLTRIESFLTQNQNAAEMDLMVRLERLPEIFNSFSKIQDEIEVKSSPEALVNEEQERIDFETRYFAIQAAYKTAVKANQRPAEAIQPERQTESVQRLPTIQLPKFSGTVSDWYSFIDTFTSIIHGDTTIDCIRKFHYLKSCLSGEALNVIQSIPVTNENYQNAWKALNDRYNNKKVMVNYHLSELFNLKPLSNENFSALRSLLDNTNKQIRALKSLGRPVEEWDDILIHLLSNKLDPETKKLWDMSLKEDNLPSFIDLEQFLEKRCFALSNISNNVTAGNNQSRNKVKTSSHATFTSSENIKCLICSNTNHKAYKCPDFTSLPNKERYQLIRNKGLCLKCFANNHTANVCKFYNCAICKQKHSKLIHFEVSNNNEPQNPPEVLDTLNTNHVTEKSNSSVFLATALVLIKSNDGHYEICRALIDSGSQSNFISDSLVRKLNVKQSKTHINICGINNTKSKTSFSVSCSLKSPQNNYNGLIDCLVVNKVTGILPSNHVDTSNWSFLNSFKLADPKFNVPDKVDILLGAEIFEDICYNETFKYDKVSPTLRNTVFGWVVIGKFYSNISKSQEKEIKICHSVIELTKQLKDFWELEDLTKNENSNESFAEQFYKDTFIRLPEGKYQVNLPFDPEKRDLELGESKRSAIKMLFHMERKRKLNREFDKLYIEFIREYLSMNHMELIPEKEINMSVQKTFYLPHHAVIKNTSNTTKLRVVFNGSKKTSTGVSLNDLLDNGEIIQDDIFTLLCRCRCKPIFLGGDVEKMFRQVKMNPECQNFQRIVWRESPNEPIREYRLKTVTYGTKPASFLAIRSLQQIAIDNEIEFPKAASIIKNDFYVDNLITALDTEDEAIELQTILSNIMSNSGFPMRQWCSNSSKVIDSIPTNLRDKVLTFSDANSEVIRTLGLEWDPNHDVFQFKPNLPKASLTKRHILSAVSRIFDPLGLISPILIRAKAFLQSLWLEKLEWDQVISNKLATEWITLENDIFYMKKIEIPRLVAIKNATNYILNGFCDASKTAYAAVIYLVSQDKDGNTKSNLLCSKTKVAPIKTITIPKLELCGTLLLAKLTEKVMNSITIKIDKINLWCDSQVCLCWITSSTPNSQIFVRNRVNQINNILKPYQHDWLYVKSKLNPADMASRGTSGTQLNKNELWWQGPEFILNITEYPEPLVITERSSIQTAVSLSTDSETYDPYKFIENCSSFIHIIRVIAHCARFVKKLRREDVAPFITARDYKLSLQLIIRLHQKKHFHDEIQSLQKGVQINKKSRLLQLTPFLDNDGLMRVGGRIRHSGLTFNKCHPYILCNNDNFTNMLINYEHTRNYHTSAHSLRYIILQNFWILRSISAIKKQLHRCITCIRFRANTEKQIMSDLPSSRLVPSNPFTHCGIDYAGPFSTKLYKGRCNKILKTYACLFICFTTHAIHIELVSDLTEDAFIAALKRFISRRGRPSDLYSDNGKNFIGAKNHFLELKKFFANTNVQQQITNFAANEFINWHNIPVYTPHMGGLWEAGVKSMKIHLKTVLTEANLTFEELYTVMTQIEAILNSRPLYDLPNNPNDLNPLTPGHFLIGAPLRAIPESIICDKKLNFTKRWELVKRISQHFWKKWSTEYISNLQSRSKWKNKMPNLQIGDLVLIKKESTSPLKWPLGRVIEVHPGKDELVRVVTIKTATTIIKRSIVTLVKLPIEIESSTQSGEVVQEKHKLNNK